MTVEWTHTKEAISSLESKLKCFVCEKVPVNPYLLWCKHSFCETCIVSRRVCPRCQFPVVSQDMVPDIMLSKLLHAIRIAAEVSKSSEESNAIDKGKATTSKRKSKKDFQIVDDSSIKIVSVNDNNSVKPSKEEPYERRNATTLEKQKNSTKNNEITTRTLRRSSRSNSPRINKQEPVEKTNVKEAKPRNISLKHLHKKSNYATSTPKTKTCPKSNTPILFSAKKVQHTNKVNSKGETLLQIACRQGKLLLVQQLLREGAEPNVKDYANWTPLCDAVGSGNIDVVRELLEAGAAVNTPSNLNTTAIVEAVVRKATDIVQLLMGYGADVNQRTTLNNTALSLADDEMKALMLNCVGPDVRIQPPPRVPITPRVVFVDDTLPEAHVDTVLQLCRKFNLTLSKAFTEEITHVVVKMTSAKTCETSTTVMLAIVKGCCVVGVDWVTSCLEAGRLVAVDEFEPCGTTDFPSSDAFHKARLNKEQLLPGLFNGCHISLQHDQTWSPKLKHDTVLLIAAAGATYQPRQCDPERIPPAEATVMFHVAPTGPLGEVSHLILYQSVPDAHEPPLKYNMTDVKSLPLSWFHKCIQTFSISLNFA